MSQPAQDREVFEEAALNLLGPITRADWPELYKLWQAAAEREREACAEVVNSYRGESFDLREIVEAIRARGKEPR